MLPKHKSQQNFGFSELLITAVGVNMVAQKFVQHSEFQNLERERERDLGIYIKLYGYRYEYTYFMAILIACTSIFVQHGYAFTGMCIGYCDMVTRLGSCC